MDNLQPEARSASGEVFAPIGASAPASAAQDAAHPVPSFTALPQEMLAALLFYVLGYLYQEVFFSEMALLSERIGMAVFTLGFLALTELLHRDTPRPRESNLWLLGLVSSLYYLVLRHGSTWEPRLALLFLHGFAVWWVLSRSGALLLGETSRFLPLDALNGFVVFPLSNLFLRIKTVKYAVSKWRGGDRKSGTVLTTIVLTLLSCVLAGALLVTAAKLLIAADQGFSSLLSGLSRWYDRLFRFELGEVPFRFLLSLPIGAYLFGLVDGTRREDKEALRGSAERIDHRLSQIRAVPGTVWFVLLALFCVLYALFFVVQGRYLFGAFTRTLPEGFIVSRYARQGFFELCRVMAVNFALLYLLTRSVRDGVRRHRPLLALCLVLLGESLLLSVVAFSKLALYISCFGFTPLRLQSAWLVCVLAFGCVCAAVSLLREWKTLRLWASFATVTYSILCFL